MKPLASLTLRLLLLASLVSPVTAPAGARSLEASRGAAAAISREASTGKVIVAYRSGGRTAVTRSAAAAGGRVTGGSESSQFVVVRTPSRMSDAEFARKLSTDDHVRYAEPVYERHAAFVPDDPLYPEQWGLKLVGAEAAWDITLGSSAVKVAIIDSGVDLSHPDLAARLDAADGYDFVEEDTTPQDEYGHGTHVAGIVSATTNNALGVASLASLCQVVPVRVLDGEGSGDSDAIARGIRWSADRGTDVINLSFAGAAYSQAEADAVVYARRKGCIVVAAAGNEGTKGLDYPARYPGVISVGSTGATDTVSEFSNYDAQLDLAAPGEDTLSTFPTYPVYLGRLYGVPGYDRLSGTSMASPLVAAAAALMASRNPTWTANEIEGTLERAALDLGTGGRDEYYGWGRLRVAEALGVDAPAAPPVVGDSTLARTPLTTSPLQASLDAIANPVDLYSIHLERGDTLEATVTVREPTASGALSLRAFAYGPETSATAPAAPVTASEGDAALQALRFTAAEEGTYLIEVAAREGSGGYAIRWKKSGLVSVSAPKSVSHDTSASVSARVVTLAGTPSAETSVTLWTRTTEADAPWRSVATTTTDANGQALFPQAIRVLRKMQYRASAVVEGAETFSDTQTISAAPVLKLTARTDVARSARFTVAGTIRPKHSASSADRVYVYFYLGKKLVKKVRTSYSGKAGASYTNYSAATSLGSKGAYTVVAKVGGHGDVHDAGTSASRILYVNRPSLSIYATRTKVTYSTPATLYGYLRARSGSVLAGRRVYLERSSDGKTWKYSKTLTTSKTGRVSTSVRPESATYYRFRSKGESLHLAQSSSAKRIEPVKAKGTRQIAAGKDYDDPLLSWQLPAGWHRLKVNAEYGLTWVAIARDGSNTALKWWEKDLAAGTTGTYLFYVSTSGRYYFQVGNTATGKDLGNNYWYELW